MIQRKKRQIRLVLLIVLAVAILGVGAWGVLKVTNKENKTEIQDSVQEDLAQYELKSIIIETTLAEEDLKQQYKVSDIETIMSGEEEESKLYLLKYSTEQETKDAYEKLQKDENMQSVDLNKKVTIDDETKKIFQWSVESGEVITSWGGIAMGLDGTLENINNKSTEKPEIIVAVIDSGLDMTHDAFTKDTTLKARVLEGFDATGKGDITDNDGHGTNVAGIVLESTPDNVKVLPIKALEKDANGKTTGTMADILSAINKAIDSGADIINMSLGAEAPNTSQQNAINKAYAKGITCIVASGNGDDKTGIGLNLDLEGNDCYPAECDNVISVGAVRTKLMSIDSTSKLEDTQYLVDAYQDYIKTTPDDLTIATFSNYGSKLDFVAPGVIILGLSKEGKIGIYDGTSQAAPHISAAAATIKSYNKDYTSDQIEEILEYYSVDLGETGKDDIYGKGFVSFKEFQECPCNSEKCDGIYCFGCEKTSCIYHKGKTNKLTSIAITEEPNKITYYNGEEFDPTGMVVTATYSDNTKKAITDYTHSSIVEIWTSLNDENPVKGYTVDIAYTEDKITRHAQQYIMMRKEDIELAPELASIEITTAPAKKEYEVGDTFDPAGMVVTAVYVDGSKQIVTNYTYPTEALTIDMTEVTISYTEDGVTKEAKQAISVKEKIVEKVLSEIRIAKAPDKTKYEVGEEFDKTGMLVMAKYTDGTEEMATDYTILPARPLEASDTKVTIQYSKNGVTKQVNQAITMNVQTTETKTVSEITVSSKPNKTSYIVGESFDPEGMIITATYSDGSKIRVMDYTFTPSGSLKATDTEIIISYNGKTTKLPITVQANAVTEPGNNEFPGLNSNMFQWEINNNSTGSAQVNQGDGTTSGGQLAYTGLEDTIIPIGICIAIAIITISYVSYRKYKDI